MGSSPFPPPGKKSFKDKNILITILKFIHMNKTIQQGIDSASLSLTYWGAERERLTNFNENIAISEEHKLSLNNCDQAITAAQAELDNQLKIAEDLHAKNELIKSDYENYLGFLKKTKQALEELYQIYPNPVLKVTIATITRVIELVEKIIGIFN